MIQKDVRVYETLGGYVPFNDWLIKLKDREARAMIRARINRLRLGLFGDCKSVGDGVFELRIFYGPGYRVYFGQHNDVTVILLCGGDKQSQDKDIKKAKHYWKDYKDPS
jgi:putative addiction module killer protein